MTRTIQIPIFVLLVIGASAAKFAQTAVETSAWTYNNGEAQKQGSAFAYADPTTTYASGAVNGQVNSDNWGAAKAVGSADAEAVNGDRHSLVQTNEHLETVGKGQAAGAAAGQAQSNQNADQAQANSNVYANGNAYASENAFAKASH